ncbi:hypothetical protein M885DRAFT_508930 [Pelagophyceae sp. CCMP2097]|nr:hypothetical protein M885DRAFT_508930 [Pelagophyceae sp. CCMP2097]
MLVSGWVDPPSWSSVAFESGPLRWNRPSCVQQGLPALRSVHKRTPRPLQRQRWDTRRRCPSATQAYAPRRSPGPDDANTPPRESPQLYHPLVYRG